MEQKYHIELIEEHDHVNFYSIHLEEEELSELERFFEKFPEGCAYDDEIDTIIAWLDKIGENGALERYFRPEGKYGDGVGVIPIDIGNKLRLYCLRVSDNPHIRQRRHQGCQLLAEQRNACSLRGNVDRHQPFCCFTHQGWENHSGG